MNRFDLAASTWDESPLRVARARAVAEAIKEGLGRGRGGEEAPLGTAIELGCGTGLLGFCLRGSFARIDLADSSAGMIAEAGKKIAAAGAADMEAFVFDIEGAEELPRRYDCVLMLMALHHVADPGRALAFCRRALEPGGSLFVADLVKEDGSFHMAEPGFKGHNGFDPETIRAEALAAGFAGAATTIVYETLKKVGGKLRAYPIFLLRAEA